MYIHIYIYLVGGFKYFLCSIIYGISSFPLTNSYFSRWLLHHQPDTHVFGDGGDRGAGLLSLLHIFFVGGVWGGVIASCGLRCQ